MNPTIQTICESVETMEIWQIEVGLCKGQWYFGIEFEPCVCVCVFVCVCDVPHRIGEQVPDAIYVEAPFNQVDAF